MRRTVFLNGRFLTRSLSGVQRSAFELIKSLDDLIQKNPQEFNNISFVVIYSGEIINPIILNHISLQKRGLLKGNLWEQLELPIYTYGKLLVSLCSISTIFKTKQILLVHDASFFINKKFFSLGFRIWYKFAIPFIANISRQIVTVSNFSKAELVKYGRIDENKITVIYNAADHVLRFKDPEVEFAKKIDLLKPYCLAVSNLAANKNFSGLNAAIKQIDFSKYNMLIAGGGISTLTYESPSDNATYLGYVTNEQLRYLYNNASLFVFPSFYEGFGIPPLEAMISGCPVIASHTSSMPEILGGASAYFNPADPNDMAKNIENLLEDSSMLNFLKELGLKRAAKFSWQKSGEQLYKLIKEYCG